MPQVIILGKTSAHPDSLIAILAIPTQHTTRVIIHTAAEIKLLSGRAALLSLISLDHRSAIS